MYIYISLGNIHYTCIAFSIYRTLHEMGTRS